MKKLLLSAATFGLLASLHAEPLSPPVLERYEQMLLGAPEPGTAFDKIYQHYLESDGLDALAKRWREAADKGGAMKGDYLLVLGLLDERRGKTEEALKELREAAEAGNSWRGWAALADVEGRAGKLASAIESYKKAIGLNPPKDAIAKLYRGLALSQQRQMDFAGAVETWEAYAKASPDDPFVLEEAGDALLDAGRFDEARGMFVKLREMKDVDPSRKLNASLRLAEVERQRGDKEAALKIYDAALAESGQASWLQHEVRSRIERLFRSDDDLPGLAAYYGKRLKAEPGDLEASLRLSEALSELNRDEESLKVLQTAAGKAPDRKDVQLKLAASLLRAERAAEAQTVLEALEKKFPADIDVVTQLGEAQWMAFKLGKGEKAVALATWRKLAPDNADANAAQRLAEILRTHELADETIAEYRRALALDPAANDRRERLAEYLMALDRRPEALAELDGMVEGDRASGENYLRLAKIQRRFGDHTAARKSLEAGAQFPDRAFDRQYLLWQMASEDKAWEEAERLAVQMRAVAGTDPEIERADDSLVESLRELKKTDAEIRRLLDRQKAAPDAFTENEWRLLFVLAMAADDNGTAEFVLGEGIKQFPKSAGLSKLENAFARRNNDAARRLASLERLEKIEPQRAGDWMAERVRALRDAERWDEAAALAQSTVALSPAKAAGHLLLADTLLAAQRKEDAVKTLKEAVRLSENPNQVRFRLADIYLSGGEYSAARDVMEEAFEAEESPAGKLQLTSRLASVYLQDGKLDDLINKLRARQKAEQGGWRYAMYLAEVYLMMGDTVRALEELDKALAGKPDDAILLKRLFGLAEGNGDTESALRYARKIAEGEPSKANRAQLGEALANEGKLDEAMILIRENSAEFLEDPSAWQDVVRALQAEEKTGELAGMLEGKLRANPDDWRSLMALAEILMGAGQTEKAAELLWRVAGMKEDPAANPPQPAPGAAPAPPQSLSRVQPYYGGAMMISGGGQTFSSAQTRQMRFGETYQRAMQMLANRNDTGAIFNRRMRTNYRGMMPPQTGLATLSQAQDDALIYLACIAAQDAREDAYLKKLSAVLKERSLEERIEIYNMLQAPEPLLSEIETEFARGGLEPKVVNAAYNAVQMIMSNRRNNPSFQGAAIPEERLKALSEKLGEQMAEIVRPQNAFQRYHLLNTLGKKEEAEKLVDQIFAGTDASDPAQVAIAMQFALMRKDYDRALDYRAKLDAARKKSGQARQAGQDFSLAMALLASETHREKAFDLLAEEFLAPAQGSRLVFGGFARQQIQWPQLRNGSVAQYLPLPTADLDPPRLNMLRSLGLNNPQMHKALPGLAKRFGVLAAEKKSAALSQAAIWLRWYSGDQEGATADMKALLAAQPADDLALNYSLMLFERKKAGEALKALDLVQARSGDTYDLAARLRLVLALQEDDQTAAKAAALKLQNVRLVDYEQRELVQQLKRLGLTEEAAKLEKKTVIARNPGQRVRQMADVMRERMENGDRGEATAIAYALLSRDPFSRAARNERYQQEQAVRALKKFGELDAYIDKLKAQLAAAPDSARLNAQLAQAMQVRDPKSAEPYYRKLAELRPKDPEWLQQFGNILVQSERFEEAMRMYDRILAENPALLFAQGTNFLEPYRRTKSWQRLSEAIAKSPDPKPDPLNPYRQNYSHVFLQIGRELQRAKPPMDPTDVWLKGLSWDENSSAQLRPMLAQALVRAGRTDDARTVIAEAFFPPGRDESSIRLFVYNRQYRPNALWSQWSSYGNGEIESTAMRLMRTANSLDLLRDLLPRIDKIAPSDDGSDPKIMARLILRDESVLPEVRKLIARAKEIKPGANSLTLNPIALRVFAGELAAWPAGRDLAYQCLGAAAQLTQVFGQDPNTIMGIQLQLASLAAEDGRPDVAKKALKAWQQAQGDWRRQGAQIDFASGLNVLKRMAALGMEGEAKQLRDTLKADRNYSQNTSYQRMLRQADNEIAISLGKSGTVVAALAWTPGAEGGRLIWDLRPAGGSEEDSRTIWMSEEPMLKASGKYSLDVYFGPDENTMKRLFSKPAAAARGTWSGKLPASPGFMRAVLRQGDEMFFGPSVSVASGTSLLSPESLEQIPFARGGVAKGWSGVPPAPASIEKGGPGGEGKFLRLDGDRQNEMELTGERIPVNPRKNYLAGCWFRYQQNNGNARVGWRVFDAAGKEINNHNGNGSFLGDRWNCVVQGLGRGNGFSGLSDNAAFIEPYVVFSGRCDLQGMFVTEVGPEGEE